VDAVWPAASTHVTVSVPTQPDAPLTATASSDKYESMASGIPLASTTSADDGVEAVIPVGRDASAGLEVAHDVRLMARVHAAASRETTRSIGAGTNTPPGNAAVTGVDAHDTAILAG